MKRIAMWSGPRNISTAMMRAWGNRPDTLVCDEPLYAHYLQQTGLPHPGAEEVVACHECDWRKVVRWLTGPLPSGKAIFYQKHMAHHLLPHIGRDWLDGLTNCFLIRDPRDVLASLSDFLPRPRLADTGLPQQVEIFERLRSSERVPPVLDAQDVLAQPRAMLEELCRQVEVDFSEAMLEWPAGPRATDGVWARYWYQRVEASTGFLPERAEKKPIPHGLDALLEDCLPLYEQLARYRLQPLESQRGE
jgi:hypothetical protein